MKRWIFGIAAMLALAVPAQAASGAWLHVRVEETGAKPTTVKVNLPVSIIEQAAPLVEEKCVRRAKLKAGKEDFDKARLQSLWKAVRDTDDGEFVTVESEDENVRVSKSGGYLLIKVRDGGEKGENVDVRVPMSVADALLSSPGDELDIMAAIHALAREGAGELVTVNDKSNVVRIWIDEKNTSD
ncbi:MAG: hypothetical protein JXO72_14790 [Vicinamibacteria bacterium]|nr:hypothetical protein [Vicinamibacteria bacterium]